MSVQFVRRMGIAFVVAAIGLVGSFVSAQYGESGRKAPANDSKTSVRTADGHPDLSGLWNGGRPFFRGEVNKGSVVMTFQARPCSPGQVDCAPGVNLARDSTFTGRMSPNRPWYRPEFWDKVQFLDLNLNKEDPAFRCQPLGLPRMGPPTKIVQTPKEAIFLYMQGDGATTATQDFRIIPLDGRPHDPNRSKDLMFYGDSIGRWEGDSLVIDSLGFNDLTWLSRSGYFHSIDMHVIERITRKGDALTWQATVDDPAVLMRPWTMDAVTLYLNPDPKATIPEGLPCDERDQEHIVTQERH